MPESALGRLVAQAAIREVKSVAREYSGLHNVSVEDASKQMRRLVEQDPLRSSWRVWGAVSSIGAAILAVPEVQIWLQATVSSLVPVSWMPVITALMGAAGAAISKARDQRPVRGKP